MLGKSKKEGGENLGDLACHVNALQIKNKGKHYPFTLETRHATSMLDKSQNKGGKDHPITLQTWHVTSIPPKNKGPQDYPFTLEAWHATSIPPKKYKGPQDYPITLGTWHATSIPPKQERKGYPIWAYHLGDLACHVNSPPPPKQMKGEKTTPHGTSIPKQKEGGGGRLPLSPWIFGMARQCQSGKRLFYDLGA